MTGLARLNFPTKLGVALQVLTLLIFGSSRRLHVDQTDRRSAFVLSVRSFTALICVSGYRMH